MLYSKIESAEDSRALQCDLSKIEAWANKWLMTFNATTSKCEILQITLNNNPIQASYCLYNHKLLCIAEAKYLGITLDSKLTFNKHVDVICKKANSVLFLLRRNLCNIYSIVILQSNPIIICQADSGVFCCVHVGPTYQIYNIGKVRAVQRCAVRFITSDYNYSYH